jgi:hypothetical protein
VKSAKNILSVSETMRDISTAIFVSKGGRAGNYSCLLTRRRDGKGNGRGLSDSRCFSWVALRKAAFWIKRSGQRFRGAWELSKKKKSCPSVAADNRVQGTQNSNFGM